MKPDIFFCRKGIIVASHLRNDYIIKSPTRRNRLSKAGSAGLKMAEKYDLEHNKKGIVFIDLTLKAYVVLPKELLVEPVGKDCQGVKNSIFSYDVNKIVNDHNLTLIPIPNEGEIPAPYETGLSGDIRKRFGL